MHGVLSTPVHRDGQLGGDSQDAHQRACRWETQESDPGVRGVPRGSWRPAYRA